MPIYHHSTQIFGRYDPDLELAGKCQSRAVDTLSSIALYMFEVHFPHLQFFEFQLIFFCGVPLIPSFKVITFAIQYFLRLSITSSLSYLG